MDRYQEYLLSKLGFIMCSIQELNDLAQVIRNKNKSFEFDKNNGLLVIKQYEDITVTKYALVLGKEVVEALSELYVLKNNVWTKISTSSVSVKNSFGSTFGYDNPQAYIIPIDFDDKIDKVKLSFVNNLANDYIIELKYVEADKDIYYAKKEQERKDNLLETASIKVATGIDLVNVYFQPCCDKYEYTEIQLFIPKDFVTVGGQYGPIQKSSAWSMIKKCKVEIEDFYKSITGLAHGKYAFILKQFDKQDNVLLETEYIEFTISSKTQQTVVGRRNRI